MTTAAVHVVLPGRRDTPTGGFRYDHQILLALAASRRLGIVVELSGTYPGRSTDADAELLRGAVAPLADHSAVVIDGLCFAPLLAVFTSLSTRLRLVALVHHPICDETGLGVDDRQRYFDQERAALALACGAIVTSATTASRLLDFGVDPERVRIVRPGVDPKRGARPRRRRGCGSKILLCVASLTPRKGQDVLLRALMPLRRFRWQLVLVGPEHDRGFAHRLRRLCREFGLQDRVFFAGAVSETRLAWYYQNADAFVLPSHHEGFGMVIAEAAQHAMPIVATTAGAIPEAAPPSAHLVPPGDVSALTAAIRIYLCGRRPPPGRVPPRPWSLAASEWIRAVDELVCL